jgi:hypothetical protein
MPSVRRPLFALFSALSLLLCVATLAGWARAQLGDSVWVRFVGHSLLVHGASGQEAALARGYFFEPAGVNDPTYEGPDGLLGPARKGHWFPRAIRRERVRVLLRHGRLAHDSQKTRASRPCHGSEPPPCANSSSTPTPPATTPSRS